MRTETLSDVGTIQYLDFEPTIPCEHSRHGEFHADQPAMFLVRCRACPSCSAPTRDYFLCLSGWEYMGSHGLVRCAHCLTVSGYRDDQLTILRVIGGPR